MQIVKHLVLSVDLLLCAGNELFDVIHRFSRDCLLLDQELLAVFEDLVVQL